MPLTQSSTKPRFASFESYLLMDPSELPEGHFEYWDGELVSVMSESIGNDSIANFMFAILLGMGIPIQILRPGKVEVEVPGRPRTRIPDFLLLEEVHLSLLERRATITREMPPPQLIMEVVSPGDENSENYKRDYEVKPQQYAAIGVLEYWIIDPDREWIKVGILTNDNYQFETFRKEEKIVSPTFPDFILTAAQILNGGRS
jgi:Uma2 family endonuclease